MQEIKVVRNTVNFEALDAELRGALGEKCIGVSVGPQGTIVHLSDEASLQDLALAEQMLTNHDQQVLTADQQAKLDQAAALETARAANTSLIDMAEFSAESSLIQQLAEKVALLELEIAALRGE